VAVSSGSFTGTLLYSGESNGKPSWAAGDADVTTLSWNGTKWRLFPAVGGGFTYYESTDADIFNATWTIVSGQGSSPTPTLTFDFVRVGDFVSPLDTRLTNTRDPNAHAPSHNLDGSDEIVVEGLATATSTQYHALVSTGQYGAGTTYGLQMSPAVLGAGALYQSDDLPAQNVQLSCDLAGTWTVANSDNLRTAISAASDSHTHGNLTNDGKVGSDSGRVLVTTTAGAVTTLALGTANQVLRVNSGATAVEFADPAASGVTGAASSASDVLGVSGANITGVDANADRLVFFDDSAGKLTHLTLGSNALTIDGTTLKSQPLFPVEPISRGAAHISYIGAATSGNSSSAVNTSGGFVLFAPVYVRKSANYTTYSVGVSTAGSASSLGKMALYTIKAADATPDALVCESGTFAADSTGIKQPTMASTFVSEGWYYMAIGTNSTTNMTFFGDTMLLLRGVFSGSTFNASPVLLDYSQKLYADFWPNPWNGTGTTFRNAFHPITSLS
jgi:hypothetical protein